MVDLLAGTNYDPNAQKGPYNVRAYGSNDLLEGIDIESALANLPKEPPPKEGGSGVGRVLSEAGKAVEGTVGTGIELGSGLVGWPVGAMAGSGALVGELLKGSSSEEAAAAFDKTMEERSEQVAGGLRDIGYTLFPTTRPEKNIYTREGSELAGKGIDLALKGARTLANVEGDLYEPLGLKPLEESHPAGSRLAGLATELLAFKVAHMGAGKAKRLFKRKQRKFNEDAAVTEETARKIIEEEVTPELEQKLLEYHPELHEAYSTEFKIGRVTEETGRRPIRMEGKAAPQKLLEAPQEVPKYTAGGDKGLAREYGKTIEGNAEAIAALKTERQSVIDQSAKLRASAEYKEAVKRAVEQKATAKDSELLDKAGELQSKSDAIGEALDNAEGRTIRDSVEMRRESGEMPVRDEAIAESKRVRDAEIAEELKKIDEAKEAKKPQRTKEEIEAEIERLTEADDLDGAMKLYDELAALEKAKVSNKYQGIRDRAGKELGGDIVYEGFTLDEVTGDRLHTFHFTGDHPTAPGATFGFTKTKGKGRVTKNDILEAGRKIIEQREPVVEAPAPAKPVEKVATEAELAETTDVIRGAKEKAAAEEVIARTQTPEQAQAKVFDVLPEAESYIARGEGAPKEIIKKLNDSLEGMDPIAGAEVINGVERVIGEITRVEKMKEATAPMKPVERPKAVDINTRRGARAVERELDAITKEVKDAGGVIEAELRTGRKTAEGKPIKPYLDFVSIRKGVKGQGRRQIMNSIDEVFKLAAKHDMDIQSPVVNMEVAKTFRDLGAVRDPSFPAGMSETGLYLLKADQVKRVVESGGVHAYRSRMRQKATPQAVADRLALIKERNEMFKGKTEDRIKAQRKLEKEISEVSRESEIERLRREQEADQALDTPEDLFNEGQYERSAYREAEMSEWDPNMPVDYGAMDFAKDLVDVFGDERGSFSAQGLTSRKIAALHRMWKKAKAEGAKLGEYFRAAMPNASDADIKRMEDFAERHFVKGEEFEVPGNADFLKKPSVRKWAKDTPNERTIVREGYPREWYDKWQEMPEIKFQKATGGKLGTTPRAAFEEVPWLRDELYRPWRHSQKVIKQRKMNMRDHFLKPLRKMVTKQGRRRIRDHAIVQQLYKRDANGEIIMDNGRPQFVQGAKELMAENNIKAIPKLTAKEQYVYEQLRKGFDVLYNEVNDMRAANGLTPFKKVNNYYPFLRAVSAMKKAGLEKELNFNRTPEKIMEEFARIKQSPFMFRRARPKHQKYRLADEPFDIFDTYASMAYEHIHTTPIVAKSRRMMSPVVRPVQKMTQKGIGRRTFDPMRGKNSEIAKYVNEWAHKISGAPMRYEAPPRVRKALNKINSNLSAAILGASLRAIFVQPLALTGTFSNLGAKYTLKGIYDLPNAAKYRRAKLKSDVLETRSPEATITQDLGRIADMKISEFPKVARNISFRGLQLLDNLTAHITWNGAYAQARAGKAPGFNEKMSVADAAKYADDAVIRTQGSGLSGEVAPIQYTSWGKTGTMFQTFVINNWNYLAKDVLGLGPQTTIGEALPKMARYVMAASAANYLFEDVAGMKSPMGRPVKAILDGIDNDNNGFEILADALAELAEPIPLASGARYGSHLFGPLVQRVGDITTGGKYGMTPKKEIAMMIDEGRFPDKTVQLMGEALGVPGTGQAMRMYRGQKRGESPWGVVAGTYTEPSERGRGRSGRSKRSSAR